MLLSCLDKFQCHTNFRLTIFFIPLHVFFKFFTEKERLSLYFLIKKLILNSNACCFYNYYLCIDFVFPNLQINQQSDQKERISRIVKPDQLGFVYWSYIDASGSFTTLCSTFSSLDLYSCFFREVSYLHKEASSQHDFRRETGGEATDTNTNLRVLFNPDA